MLVCPQCGLENAGSAAVCRSCAAPLGPAPAEPTRHLERRSVTALFCDLVGSVELTSRLGAEEALPLIEGYYSICETVIERRGGNIVQYLGDGVLAYFGFPKANEDDPINAVEAALEIRDEVASPSTPDGALLRVRVGIATGLVVISDLVGRRKSRGGGMVGETLNLAARLQSIAPVNGVVACETTRRIAGGHVSFRDLGAAPLKGFPAPVPAFEAVAATRSESRFDARSRGQWSALVGRDAQMARLKALWAQAAAGKGASALLRGEPGIGKSRLAEEIARIALAEGAKRMVWYCAPNRGDSALYPVAAQIARSAHFEDAVGLAERRARLEAFLGGLELADPTTLAAIGDLVGAPAGASEALAGQSPDKKRADLFDALVKLLRRSFGAEPGLLVVEDLHWIDSVSLALLDRVIRLAADQRWLILLTARPEFETPWPQTDVERIEAPPLGRGGAMQLCLALGARSVLSNEAIDQIVERSDGVPLFIEEMTRAVLEAAPAGGEGASAAPPIPPSVRASLAARIDRLGAARRTAALGAAIGRRFGYRLLAAVSEGSEAQLRADLRELSLSGLVERHGAPPSSYYVFRHALIRDAAYDSLPRRERLTLHGRIAQTLRDQFPDVRGSEPELLAYHFTESGAVEDAAPLWAEAGRRAAARAAHVEAVGHLRNALDLVRRAPQGPARAVAELPLLQGLGFSLSASHGYSDPEVGELFGQAQAICDTLGNSAALLPVLIGIAQFRCVVGEMAAAEAVARQCLAIAEQTGQAEHLITANRHVGYVLWGRGRLPEAGQKLERAIAIYRERRSISMEFVGTQDPFIQSCGALLYVRFGLGDRPSADRAAEEMVAHARFLGRPFDLAFALAFRSGYWSYTGDYARTHRDAEEMVRLCEEHGYSMYRTLGQIFIGLALGHLRGLEEGLPLIHKGMADVARMGVKHSIAGFCHRIAILHAAHGDWATALDFNAEGLALASGTGDEFYLPRLHLARARFLEASGAGGAEAEARRALKIAETQGAVFFADEARQWLLEHGALTAAM